MIRRWWASRWPDRLGQVTGPLLLLAALGLLEHRWPFRARWSEACASALAGGAGTTMVVAPARWLLAVVLFGMAVVTLTVVAMHHEEKR